MRALPLTLLFSALLLTGCLRHGTCVDEPDNRFCQDAGRSDAGPRPDAGMDAALDAGPDGGMDADAGSDAGPDAGPCSGACSGETPHCSDGGCVGCRDADDCDATEVCRSTDNTCQECELNTDCDGNPAGGVCADGTCVECVESADCTDNPNGNVCDTNTCGCSDDDDCTDSQCRTDDGVCGGTLVCETCTADTDCEPNHDCVPMFYGGTTSAELRDDRYCLRRSSEGCSPPFVGILMREPTAGGGERSYCGIAELITTCEAVNGLRGSRDCSVDPCVGEGALCATVGGVPNRCTSRCASAANCLAPEGAYGHLCPDPDGYCQ